jgi:hypothetical protein
MSPPQALQTFPLTVAIKNMMHFCGRDPSQPQPALKSVFKQDFPRGLFLYLLTTSRRQSTTCSIVPSL